MGQDSGETQSLHRVCLILGSNIDPEVNLPRAIRELRLDCAVEAVSGIWESPAVGGPGPDYLNAAVVVQTDMAAEMLKHQVLRPLETRLGRVRTDDKYAPRTIDIDIVTFNADIVDDELWERAHKSAPAAELIPCYQSASGEYLEQAAERLAKVWPIRRRNDLFPSELI